MGFFDSSRAHLDQLEKDCQAVQQRAAQVRAACERSLRGKYEYMDPAERADLVREARGLLKEMSALLDSARDRQKLMEQDQCPSEDLLAAQTLVLSASMDAQKAAKSLGEAKQSLVASAQEIEDFYGPRSREAKDFRKLVAEFA